jgi:hypothetical protein
MSIRYLPAAALLVGGLALSAPAAAIPHESPAEAATQAFKRYVYEHTVPPGDNFGTFGFAGFGCYGARHRRYECEVTSATCRVSGVVMKRGPGTYRFRSIRISGDCPKWHKLAFREPRQTAEPCATLQTPIGGPGPTGVVGLLYVSGGPAPGCPQPLAGEVLVEEVSGTAQNEIVDHVVHFASGPVVARASVPKSGLFEILLPPGTYMLTAELPWGLVLHKGPLTVTAEQQTPALIEDDVP